MGGFNGNLLVEKPRLLSDRLLIQAEVRQAKVFPRRLVI